MDAIEQLKTRLVFLEKERLQYKKDIISGDERYIAFKNSTFAQLIEVMDAMEMEQTNIAKQLLQELFDAHDLKPLAPPADKLADFIEIVGAVEADLAKGKIVDIKRKGYTLAGEIIRKSKVTVAK